MATSVAIEHAERMARSLENSREKMRNILGRMDDLIASVRSEPDMRADEDFVANIDNQLDSIDGNVRELCDRE